LKRSAVPDPTPADAPAEPRLVELSTLAEQTEAIETLIGLARQHIRVFDQDLSQTGWGSAGRADRLAAFLREGGVQVRSWRPQNADAAATWLRMV